MIRAGVLLLDAAVADTLNCCLMLRRCLCNRAPPLLLLLLLPMPPLPSLSSLPLLLLLLLLLLLPKMWLIVNGSYVILLCRATDDAIRHRVCKIKKLVG